MALMTITALLLPIAAVADLANAGFESDLPASGWEICVYGAPSEIAADASTAREGRQSVRIAARAPSDTALGQNSELPPNALYRLTGWVKTRDLAGEPGVRVGGTVQIQDHENRVLFAGKSHFGTNDWCEERILFRVPADGKVRIAVFFVGYGTGTGTGTAWFDGLRLEPVPESAAARIVVRNERQRDAPISPYQGGQFVEPLADLVPGMQEERILDDSFEGLAPYRFEHRPEVDLRPRPWYPSGACHLGEYARDEADPANGKVSLRIRAGGGRALPPGDRPGRHLGRGGARDAPASLRER
ncbi:MAG: hypothetical protein AB1726_14375 [Planctomycetota bacterium]